MKRFFKWFTGIVVLLVVLLVSAVLALPYLIDPNEYKPQIIAQLKPHMHGRDLHIPGDIKLSIFPWLGADIGEVVIGNAEGFVLKPFMTIKHARAEVRLLSLFSDRPEIGSLVLDDVQVYLQQDAEGRNNWSDLASTQTPTAQYSAIPRGFIRVANTPAPAGSGFVLPPLKIAGIHMRNMRIELDDKKSRDILTLYKMNVDAGPIDRFNPVPLKGQFQFSSKKHELLAASAFATTMELTPKLDEFVLRNFNINTNLTGKGVQNKTIKTSLKIPDLKLETQAEKVTARPFYLKLDNIDSNGRFSLRRFSKPVVRLGWEISELNLDRLLPKVIAEQSSNKEEAVVLPGEEPIPEIAEVVVAEKVDDSARLFAPLALFANTDMQGTLKIGKLIYHKMNFDNVKINLLARAGLVSALPSADIYGGKYSGDLQIQTAKGQASRVRSKQKFENIPLGPVVKALYDREIVNGTFNFSGQFFSQGETQKSLTENLSGDGQFNVRNTELSNDDVKRLILKKHYDKLSFVGGKDKSKQTTVFDSVRGSLNIKQGVVYNRDLRAVSRRVHINGKGHADLNEQTVNYTLTTIPQKPMAFSFAGRTVELRNRDINTHLVGPWDNIDVNNDLDTILKEEFRQTELYQKGQAKEDELKSKLKLEEDKLKQKLKDKFKL